MSIRSLILVTTVLLASLTAATGVSVNAVASWVRPDSGSEI